MYSHSAHGTRCHRIWGIGPIHGKSSSIGIDAVRCSSCWAAVDFQSPGACFVIWFLLCNLSFFVIRRALLHCDKIHGVPYYRKVYFKSSSAIVDTLFSWEQYRSTCMSFMCRLLSLSHSSKMSQWLPIQRNN